MTEVASRSWEWSIVGMPKAQGRPRFARVGRFVRTYDPATSRDWKELVKLQLIESRPIVPLGGPLILTVLFRLPAPKSIPKRWAWHIKRPDGDNLEKAVKDAMKGIVYRDDSQIVVSVTAKCYSETPGVSIRLEEITIPPARSFSVSAVLRVEQEPEDHHAHRRPDPASE